MTRVIVRMAGHLAAAVLLATLAGCGTTAVQGYPGARRAPEQVAQINLNPPGADVAFVVKAVDGHAIQASDQLELLPGRHTIKMDVTPTPRVAFEGMSPSEATDARKFDTKHRRDANFTIPVEAGKRYGLDGRFEEGSYQFWLYELSTERVVERGGS